MQDLGYDFFYRTMPAKINVTLHYGRTLQQANKFNDIIFVVNLHTCTHNMVKVLNVDTTTPTEAYISEQTEYAISTSE